MPLGQAPYGSRQQPSSEPPEDDPRARGEGYARFGRQLFFIGGGVLLLLLVLRGGLFRGNDKNPHGPLGPSPCLTDRSCADGWRCFVQPKDDPFATEGVCAQGCQGDLQCPAHYRCEPAFVTKGKQVVPAGARGAGHGSEFA